MKNLESTTVGLSDSQFKSNYFVLEACEKFRVDSSDSSQSMFFMNLEKKTFNQKVDSSKQSWPKWLTAYESKFYLKSK